ncbi:MAG: hypothetical protein IKU38_00085, partial [Clostridia bacterium]|nr:hypothetical protein [Clostridia bacterium]
GGGGAGSSVAGDQPGPDSGSGGSGVVIIRSNKDAYLPVWFDGGQLKKIFFNGSEVSGLIYDGTRLFARKLHRWIQSLHTDMQAA